MRSTPGACRVSSLCPPIIRCAVRLARAYHFCSRRNTMSEIDVHSSGGGQAIKAAFWAFCISNPDTTAHTSSANRATNDRRDLGREQLDHPGHVRKRQAADVDLCQETLVAEQLALIQDLVDDLLRAADKNRAMRSGAFLIIVPGDLLRAVLRGGVGKKIAGIVRIKAVQGVLR